MQNSPSALSCPSAINRCCKVRGAASATASTTPSDLCVSLDDMARLSHLAGPFRAWQCDFPIQVRCNLMVQRFILGAVWRRGVGEAGRRNSEGACIVSEAAARFRRCDACTEQTVNSSTLPSPNELTCLSSAKGEQNSSEMKLM